VRLRIPGAAESKSDEYNNKIKDISEFSSFIHPLAALRNFPRSERRRLLAGGPGKPMTTPSSRRSMDAFLRHWSLTIRAKGICSDNAPPDKTRPHNVLPDLPYKWDAWKACEPCRQTIVFFKVSDSSPYISAAQPVSIPSGAPIGCWPYFERQWLSLKIAVAKFSDADQVRVWHRSESAGTHGDFRSWGWTGCGIGLPATARP
jgi:hypothetical protein